MADRPLLTDMQVRVMITMLLRKPELFNRVRNKLDGQFADIHRPYAVVWEVFAKFMDEFGVSPTEDEWLAEAEAVLAEAPDLYSEEDRDLMESVIVAASGGMPEEKVHDKLAMRYAARYLEDRALFSLQQELGSGYSMPEGFQGLLQKYVERVASSSALAGSFDEVPFPDEDFNLDSDPVIDMLQTSSTRFALFDTWMNGGQAPAEVYLFMAPHGSCKTTLGIQLSSEQALAAHQQWEASGKSIPLPFYYYFFYEGTKAEMKARATSCCANVPQTTLQRGEVLSTRGSLKPYERELFGSSIGQAPGERERILSVRRRLNVNYRLYDMGGDPDHPGRGKGLVGEWELLIRGHQEEMRERYGNVCVGAVFIDYVGAAVRRYFEDNPKERANETRLLHDTPGQVVYRIAKPMQCPVWLFHQLSGVVNGYPPGRLPRRTDAYGCTSIAENVNFCVTAGNPTKEEGLVGFLLEKGRRVSGQLPEILKVDGNMSRVRETGGKYTIDHRTSKIISRRDMAQIDMSASPRGAFVERMSQEM